MLKVFIDSDVIISSLISSTGAAYMLLHEVTDIELCISSLSKKEIEKVVKRMSLSDSKLYEVFSKRVSIVSIPTSISEIKKQYSNFVLDIDDAHIVAGAKESDAQFLITYNTKHYKADKIKEDCNIIILTPATFLQFLRSR